MCTTIQRACLPVLFLGAMTIVSGCTGGLHSSRGFQQPRVHRDIVSVNTFYIAKPWLNFDVPPTNIPGGLKFALYTTGANSARGVFGDGTIHIDMYRVETEAGIETKRSHVRRWSFNTEQAYPYRAKREVRFGRGYGFRLDWRDSDVLGKEIMIVASFERLDGRIIYSQPKYLKVPEKV